MGKDDTGPGGPGRRSDPGVPEGADVIEQDGGRLPSLTWRPSRGAALLGLAGLAVGLIAGFAAGDHRAVDHGAGDRARLARPSPAPAAGAAVGAILAQGNAGCSAQVGRQLQLGEQVTNQSRAAVTLRSVAVMLPLGGLRAVSQQWEPCGVLPGGLDQPSSRLAPGASIWFTVTFQVLTACPGSLPVQFSVDYDQRGQHAAVRLPGFPDLTGVSYSGCPAS